MDNKDRVLTILNIVTNVIVTVVLVIRMVNKRCPNSRHL